MIQEVCSLQVLATGIFFIIGLRGCVFSIEPIGSRSVCLCGRYSISWFPIGITTIWFPTYSLSHYNRLGSSKWAADFGPTLLSHMSTPRRTEVRLTATAVGPRHLRSLPAGSPGHSRGPGAGTRLPRLAKNNSLESGKRQEGRR